MEYRFSEKRRRRGTLQAVPVVISFSPCISFVLVLYPAKIVFRIVTVIESANVKTDYLVVV